MMMCRANARTRPRMWHCLKQWHMRLWPCPVLWILAAVAWRRGFWGPVWRVFYTLIAVVLVTFLWVLSRWGLIEL